MNTEECKIVIDAMADIGVGMIGWTGGEPLLREDLEELIAYTRTKGIKSNVTTNGVLLDLPRAEGLVAAGNRAIQISLDGSTPERNRRMRGTTEEEFYKIIEAIRICKELNCRLVLATLLGQENLEDGLEMIKLARREEADTIRFCGYTPVGRGKRADIRKRLDFSESLADLRRFAEEVVSEGDILVEFDTGFGPVPPDYRFHACVAGEETFYLRGDGDVFPCTALIHRHFRVGNLREKSLREIWNAPEMRAIASFPREEIEGPCRDCDNFASCRGACRGATFFHTGDIKASFPMCLYRVTREAKVTG
jgi:radical SAM protein with 4Fe4S-binding SPASM domain